ncbi:MAG: AAA family ATPase [Candidatus Micrarchaeota archaeon]
MLFSEKHCPTSVAQLAGNKTVFSRMRQWAMQFTMGKAQKPLLLWGPPGCGKSAAARALASEMGWPLVPIYPPEEGEGDRWEKKITSQLAGSSLFGEPSLTLADDVDSWSKIGVRGSLSKFLSAVKTSNVPLIITAKDAYDRSVSALRSNCEPLQLRAINASDLEAALRALAAKEKMVLSDEQFSKLASNSGGDLRAAINDLEAHNFAASREKDRGQFEVVRACFRSPTYAAAKRIPLGDLSARGTLKLYVAENMPAELCAPDDLANGFDLLSRADVFDGRIRARQYWGYLRYSSDLLVFGPSSARRKPKASFVSYAFPSYIQKMGSTKSRRALDGSLARRIAVRTHTTTRVAKQYLPLLEMQAKALAKSGQDPMALSVYYRFDDDDFAGLLEISPDSLAVNNGKTKAAKAK